MTEHKEAWVAIREVVSDAHYEFCRDGSDEHDHKAAIDEKTTELYRAVAEEVMGDD